MLGALLHAFGAEFMTVVVSVYGASQGVGTNWMYPAVSYMLMVERAYHPYVAQTIMTVARLPWSIKIVYGLLSDRVSLWGGRRRGPYLVVAACVGIACWAALLFMSASSASVLTLLLVGGYLSNAIPDVIVDAAVTERTKLAPPLAPALQSLCWGSYAVGGLIGSASSGFLIESLAARATLGLLIAPALCVLITGANLRDVVAPSPTPGDIELTSRADASLINNAPRSDGTTTHADATSIMTITVLNVVAVVTIACVTLSTNQVIVRGITTLVCALGLTCAVYCSLRRLRAVDAAHAETLARVAIYIFLREAVVPSVDAAMYAWYTVDDDGPHFSITFLGFLSTLSLLFMLGGVALYQRYLKHYSYRSLFMSSHVLLACCALIDVAFVVHVNRALGIPDRLFALGDTALGPIVSRLSLMPMFALAARLCPDGTEATLYALLMSLSNFGVDVGSYAGAVLLWMTEHDEEHGLRNALIVRTIARLLPVALVPFLVPHGFAVQE